MVVMVKL